jgi:hypothetical protein
VFSEALTFQFARFASHCDFGLFRALHDSIIQLAIVVMQAINKVLCDLYWLYFE